MDIAVYRLVKNIYILSHNNCYICILCTSCDNCYETEVVNLYDISWISQILKQK